MGSQPLNHSGVCSIPTSVFNVRAAGNGRQRHSLRPLEKLRAPQDFSR